MTIFSEGIGMTTCLQCSEALDDETDVYCHTCYTALNDEHDKVRAVHGSLDELEDLYKELDNWGNASLDIPPEEVGDLADKLRKIIDTNKEAWGL
jgi:DNA phosphorothioation-dependent restriction protein DptG